MKEKRRLWLPILFLVAFAISRIPGMMSEQFGNFSAAYALAFCAGVYFRGSMRWWFPLGAIVLTDLGLNCYYYFVKDVNAFQPWQLMMWGTFAVLILLGRSFRPGQSWLWLLSGGLLGAVLFYLITNTGAWLFNPFGNPEYTKDFTGWLTALTKGATGYPPTWMFFKNTLLSGGLFTGLFVGAAKWSAMAETEEEEEESETGEEAGEAEPEESHA